MARKTSEFYSVTIEFPSQGSTYSEQEYGVYGYGEYPESSVLAGQERRVYLGAWPTLEAAQAAHPEASWTGPGSQFQEVSLDHLPGDDDSDPLGDNRDAWEAGQSEAGQNSWRKSDEVNGR